jgi:hypothetical protein
VLLLHRAVPPRPADDRGLRRDGDLNSPAAPMHRPARFCARSNCSHVRFQGFGRNYLFRRCSGRGRLIGSRRARHPKPFPRADLRRRLGCRSRTGSRRRSLPLLREGARSHAQCRRSRPTSRISFRMSVNLGRPDRLPLSGTRPSRVDWDYPQKTYCFAGPMVRIRLPPAVSRQTIGSSVAEPHLRFVMCEQSCGHRCAQPTSLVPGRLSPWYLDTKVKYEQRKEHASRVEPDAYGSII